MVAVERRLGRLTSELTARERAVLCLRAWCEGEEADERVIRYCPPQDKTEMERIRRAVEHASIEAHSTLIILLEWTAHTEAEIHRLRVLTAYQEHVAALEAVAKKEVRPMPPPWETSRKVPMGYGRLVSEEDEGVAQDWDDFRLRCLKSIEESLTFRWKDALGIEAVFDDLAKTMGEAVMHQTARRLLDGVRDSVLRLTREVESFDEDFQLPGEPGEHGAVLRNAIDWDAIRGAPPVKHAREWMYGQQAAELEAWEREQAEELRAR
jgi:hypothetical protein